MNSNQLSQIEQAKTDLRDNSRIKINTDFAVIVKYGEVHILCHHVYEETIREAFEQYDVAIHSLHTYADTNESKLKHS